MWTDLASVPVINLLPLSSKSTLNYLLYENGEGPYNNIFPFPSGMMLCMSVEGAGETPEEEGVSLPGSGPLSASHSFPLCYLSTAKLQQPTAPS